MNDPALESLQNGFEYRFADWPNEAVPAAAAGVYTIWEGPLLVYVGMSGRGLTAEHIADHTATGLRKGLHTRLASHASGRRSGDQFCVYVADRLVMPKLTADEVLSIAGNLVQFDGLVKRYISDRLTYKFVTTSDGAEAFAIENKVRRGALPAGRPLLNPA